MTQLRSVTCHMGSHSVTCYPTQVNTPRLNEIEYRPACLGLSLNPRHAGRYSIYLPRRDERLSWPSWVEPVTFQSQVQRWTNAPPRLYGWFNAYHKCMC